jgi:hypothetical protein
MEQSAYNKYINNISTIEVDLKKVTILNKYFYFIRLFTFSLIILFLVLFLKFDYNFIHLVISGVSLVLFLFVVKINFKSTYKESFLSNQLIVNKNELNFLAHNYQFCNAGEEFKYLNPHLADDFDLFGQGSMFQYLNRCSTNIGKTKFAESLCKSVLNGDEIFQKQQAINELSNNIDFIQNFQTHGMFINETGSEVSSIQSWLEESEGNTKFLKSAVIAFPLLNIAWITLIILGVFTVNSLLFPLLISLLVIFFNKHMLDLAHNRLSKTAKTFEKYTILIKLIENEEFTSPLLKELKQKLTCNDLKASHSLKILFNLLNNFDIRYNVIVSFLLNSLVIFDLQIFLRLEKWKQKNKDSVTSWFSVLSEIDALMSYSVFAFNNRGLVTVPTISEKQFIIDGTDLGHPLLHPSIRINNSVKIAGSPSVIIITGANMAGKSTFLRTLSVNLILAMNGAPVCAKDFIFSPCDIMSSIKIQDSLSNQESYFYAELLRIKEIINHVKAQPKTLVILDEILRGTNTKDKQLGSLGLLEKLISRNAVAIIATHDLEIGQLEKKFPEIVANYCFEVELQNDQLIFDYKLKKGISSKLNASFLMKKMEIID